MASSRAGPVKAKRRVTSPPSPFASTSASRLASRHAMLSLSSPKRMRSPGSRRLAGRAKARQRSAPSRVCNMISTRAVASPRARSPKRRARITLVSLRTSASPGRSRSGRSRTRRFSSEPAGGTTSSRALSRGIAGRSAMRSSGRSKSKASTRIGSENAHEDGASKHQQHAGDAPEGDRVLRQPKQAEMVEDQPDRELAEDRCRQIGRGPEFRSDQDRRHDDGDAEAASGKVEPERRGAPFGRLARDQDQPKREDGADGQGYEGRHDRRLQDAAELGIDRALQGKEKAGANGRADPDKPGSTHRPTPYAAASGRIGLNAHRGDPVRIPHGLAAVELVN